MVYSLMNIVGVVIPVKMDAPLRFPTVSIVVGTSNGMSAAERATTLLHVIVTGAVPRAPTN
jgi:hypothetical protein